MFMIQALHRLNLGPHQLYRFLLGRRIGNIKHLKCSQLACSLVHCKFDLCTETFPQLFLDTILINCSFKRSLYCLSLVLWYLNLFNWFFALFNNLFFFHLILFLGVLLLFLLLFVRLLSFLFSFFIRLFCHLVSNLKMIDLNN